MALGWLLVLSLLGVTQSTRVSEACLADAPRALRDHWGPILAHGVVAAAATVLRGLPHLAAADALGLDARPTGSGPACCDPRTVPWNWPCWPAYAALHFAALATWIGWLVPLQWILLRSGPWCRHAPEWRLQAHWSPRPPVWRRAIGVVPVLTLVWSLGGIPTLALAPGIAVVWLWLAAWLGWSPAGPPSSAILHGPSGPD